jgi:RsiW-degrading membrane proteinase PrsW (M82 family)
MERFFGGNPAAVMLRLVFLSLIVGVLLAALGLDARDIVSSIERLFVSIWNLGFESVEWLVRYFLLGAVIVFPIWLLSRIFRVGARSPRREPAEWGSRNSGL